MPSFATLSSESTTASLCTPEFDVGDNNVKTEMLSDTETILDPQDSSFHFDSQTNWVALEKGKKRVKVVIEWPREEEDRSKNQVGNREAERREVRAGLAAGERTRESDTHLRDLQIRIEALHRLLEAERRLRIEAERRLTERLQEDLGLIHDREAERLQNEVESRIQMAATANHAQAEFRVADKEARIEEWIRRQ